MNHENIKETETIRQMNGKEKWETKWETGTGFKGRERITEILLAKKRGRYFVQRGDEGPGVDREEGGGEGRNPI